MIRLAIYDDHPLVVHGLEAMLTSCANIELTGCYNSESLLMKGLNERQTDVLIAICREGDCYNNLPVTIHKSYPKLAILILVGESSVGKLKNMISHGRKGYLMKNTGKDPLIEAIEAVYRGEIYIDPKLKELLLLARLTTSKSTQLSEREKQVLQLITEEYTNLEIAARLFISPRTVENHRIAIMQKLGVKNTAGLVRLALQSGLAN